MKKYGLAFDLVESGHELRQLEDFLINQPGSYDPAQHTAWIEGVCIPGIAAGDRRALGWYRHGDMIGDAVLKVSAPDMAELKNFRVIEGEMSDRGLAHFLMTQATHEARELLVQKNMITTDANAITLRLDTTAGGDAESFFAHYGFRRTGEAALYVPGRMEALMELTVPLH